MILSSDVYRNNSLWHMMIYPDEEQEHIMKQLRWQTSPYNDQAQMTNKHE